MGVLVGIVRMILWTNKGEIGRWKLTKVDERTFVGDYRGGFYAQLGLWKWKSAYYIIENSTYFVLEIELLLTVLSNFEREVAIKGLAFWWVACLTHKILRSVYSLIKNLIGLAWHMV